MEAGCGGQMFRYQDLVDHTIMAAQAPAFFRLVLGDAWKKWYPETDPSSTSLVPQKVAMLVYLKLDQLRATWEQENHVADAAMASYVALSSAAKRHFDDVEASDMDHL